MKKYLIYFCFTLIFANDFLPLNNSVKNYTQIFFRWPQIEGADIYKLQIYDYQATEQIEIYTNSNSQIVEDFLIWDNDYIWQICGYNASGDILLDCHDEMFFSINDLPGYYPNQINLLVSNSQENNITVLDFDSSNFSAAIDENGIPVWFVDKTFFPGTVNQRIIVTEYLNSGNFIGFGYGLGFEFDIDGNIIFQTPAEYGAHHHFIKRDNSYFLIDAISEYHPCPQPCPENLPDTISWQADRFVQINSNGQALKEWNLFDYIDLTEYNPLYLERLSNSYPDEIDMDWTHSNSIFYDGENIFLSIRNLSRILKLSYDTDELIWHLGNTEFMNQIYFEENIEFSQQHSVQVLDNNNIIFFDNHSLLEPELSRCIEFSYNEDNYSINQEWEFILPESMFTGSRGECDRLENGNTLITAGRSGNMLEVNNNEIIWHLEAKHNGNSVTMYRGQRASHLYPLAFSIEINNLQGDYENYFIESDSSFIFKLHNKGWSDQSYNYYIENEEGDTLITGSFFIESENSIQEQINFQLLEFLNQQIYTLIVNPVNNYNFVQSIEFRYVNLLGDINGDQTVDVIDIIAIINLILESDYDLLADLNNDEILNILDIVLLVNLILYE